MSCVLPLGAKRLKPGASHQAASRARQDALSSPQQASAAACPDACGVYACAGAVRRCARHHVQPPSPVKHKRQECGTACPSRVAGTATAHHAARWHSALLRARMHPPPSLHSRAWLRSAAPSTGKRHTNTEPSHPWHREHGYKRAPPTSCPHRTLPAVFL
jgi:hypothetical protein